MFNLRIFSGNCNGKKLTVICETAKILIVIRKSNHCIQRMQCIHAAFNAFRPSKKIKFSVEKKKTL